MPLESNLPAIDDRRYSDILDELRTRVPRYTPEWTDLNDSDPGMALVQLFAWLADILLYRLARVPEQNYIKFLELLGIELLPAAPAVVEITFPVLNSSPESTVIIPLHTQVSAPAEDGGSPVIFETDRALVALKSRLLSVQTFSSYDYTDLSVLNEGLIARGFLPFGELADPGTALLLGFDSANPLPQVNLDLTFYAVDLPGATAYYSCDLPASPFSPPATIAWECWTGRDWASLSRVKDDTRALTRSGHLILQLPAPNRLQPASIGAVSEQRFWLRGRVVSGLYEQPPQLQAIRTNTVSATQAETRRDESLGGSNGRPGQSFQVENTPVLAGTLRLEVDEGDGFRAWTEVDDLFGSQPDDTHYMLNRTTGTIKFGDGLHGRIPVGNVNNVGNNIVAREYRYGGGTRGNGAAVTLTTLLTTIQGIDEAEVQNLRAASGGRDEEKLEDAKQRARQTLKSKCRAVTSDDFEGLAMQAANVRRALAMPLTHPDFPGTKAPGVMTVVVVPDSKEPNPIPSEGTLRTVCAYLNQRRLLTTEVYVIRPTYKQVSISVGVVVDDNADLAEVKDGIEKNLLAYFHPLTGGTKGQGWPFGGTIYYSQIYNRIFEQPGVQRIENLVIAVDGEEAAPCQDVEIPDGELVYSTGHDVRPGYSYEV